MTLNETITKAMRAMQVAFGSDPITVHSGFVQHHITALVVDNGVCRLDGPVASFSDERAHYASALIIASDIPVRPERGDRVTMLGRDWQLRYAEPSGVGSGAIIELHCVANESGRAR